MDDSSVVTVTDSGPGAVVAIIYLAIILLVFVSMWKVFSKAGQPGWACIIPIFNFYIMLKVAGKPGWWLLLMFVPIVNIVISIIVYLGIAEGFNKGAGFGIGLAFLPMIFFPILAFGSAQYSG